MGRCAASERGGGHLRLLLCLCMAAAITVQGEEAADAAAGPPLSPTGSGGKVPLPPLLMTECSDRGCRRHFVRREPRKPEQAQAPTVHTVIATDCTRYFTCAQGGRHAGAALA